MFQEYLKNYFWDYFIYKVDHTRLPDVYLCNSKGVAWIELKVIKSNSRDGLIRPEWRPGQLAWIQDQKRIGGIDNVSLMLYHEPSKECRLYSKCLEYYYPNELYKLIRKN